MDSKILNYFAEMISRHHLLANSVVGEGVFSSFPSFLVVL